MNQEAKPYLIVTLEYIVPVEDANIEQQLQELRGYGTARVLEANVRNMTRQEFEQIYHGRKEEDH